MNIDFEYLFFGNYYKNWIYYQNYYKELLSITNNIVHKIESHKRRLKLNDFTKYLILDNYFQDLQQCDLSFTDTYKYIIYDALTENANNIYILRKIGYYYWKTEIYPDRDSLYNKCLKDTNIDWTNIYSKYFAKYPEIIKKHLFLEKIYKLFNYKSYYEELNNIISFYCYLNLIYTTIDIGMMFVFDRTNITYDINNDEDEFNNDELYPTYTIIYNNHNYINKFSFHQTIDNYWSPSIMEIKGETSTSEFFVQLNKKFREDHPYIDKLYRFVKTKLKFDKILNEIYNDIIENKTKYNPLHENRYKQMVFDQWLKREYDNIFNKNK